MVMMKEKTNVCILLILKNVFRLLWEIFWNMIYRMYKMVMMKENHLVYRAYLKDRVQTIMGNILEHDLQDV